MDCQSLANLYLPTAADFQGYSSTHNHIPYTKYFELCSYKKWSLHNYVTLIIGNYEFADKEAAHFLFYHILQNILNDLSMPQEIRTIAQRLVDNKKVSIINIIIRFNEEMRLLNTLLANNHGIYF